MNTGQATKAADLAVATDESLVRRSLAGQHEAFEWIMRRNNQRLFRIARAIVRNDSDAEDAVQDGYLKAWLHLSSFEWRSSLGTWLSRLVANEALGRLRARRFEEPAAIDDEVQADRAPVIPLFAGVPAEPADQAAGAELRAILETAIDSLPEPFRAVFVLREVEGMSVAEIADLLGIPEATVKTRGFRARRLLRAELEEQLAPLLRDAYLFLGERCDRIVRRVLDRIRGIDPGPT